jgi:hypothetical protein
MWMEWLGRTLGAHSPEDYAGRRARRLIDDTGGDDDLAIAEGSAMEATPDAVMRGPPQGAYG